MRYMSIIIIAVVVGLGSLALNVDQARAQDFCVITIEKVAIPADDTPFTFIVSGNDSSEFVLMDPSDPITGGPISIDETLIIAEEVPPGWELDSIECTQGQQDCDDVPCLNITIDEETNSITAECLAEDEGSCTFTNVRVATTEVPTLSEWGLIAMAGVLGIVGFMVMRRRKVTA